VSERRSGNFARLLGVDATDLACCRLDDLKSYAMRIKRQDALADIRRKALAATAEEGSDTVAAEREDEQLQSLTEVSRNCPELSNFFLLTTHRVASVPQRKASLTFRALRQAAMTSLDLFASIKPELPPPGRPHAYVEILLDAKAAAEELEAERAAKPTVAKATPPPSASATVAAVAADEISRPSTPIISISGPTDELSIITAVPATNISPAPSAEAALPSVEMAEPTPSSSASSPAGSPASASAADARPAPTSPALSPTETIQAETAAEAPAVDGEPTSTTVPSTDELIPSPAPSPAPESAADA
jgi:hypothetical protein